MASSELDSWCVHFFYTAGCLPFSVSPFPPACSVAADISLRHSDFLCVWSGACTLPSAAAVSRLVTTLPRRAACQYIQPLACRWPCRPTFSGVPRKVAYACSTTGVADRPKEVSSDGSAVETGFAARTKEVYQSLHLSDHTRSCS